MSSHNSVAVCKTVMKFEDALIELVPVFLCATIYVFVLPVAVKQVFHEIRN